MGSRIRNSFFLRRASSGILPITDPEMTRFNISLSEGVDMVLWTLENSLGGELFVLNSNYRLLMLKQLDHPVKNQL